MMTNPFQWEHPKAMDYNDTIRRRIIGYDLIFELMKDLIDASIEQPEHITIVGAGGGQELSTLLPLLPAAHFKAIDPSSTMLALAEQRLVAEELSGDVAYIEAELTAAKLEPADLVTCHLVLHFLPTIALKKALLHEIAMHVKVGGTVYLSSINGDLEDAAFQQTLTAWGKAMIRNGVKEHQWQAFRASFGDTLMPISTVELLKLCDEVGLQIRHAYFRAYHIEAFCLERVK